MPKTYRCPDCGEQMEAKYKDQNGKTIWYCKKCDGFFGIEIPFRYTLPNEEPTQEELIKEDMKEELYN